MKPSVVLAIVFLLSWNSVFSQRKPYNSEFKFRDITNGEYVEKADSIQGLFVTFENQDLSNFRRSIEGNPQIRELKLFNATQEALDIVMDNLGDSLTHLFLIDYTDSTIEVNGFPALNLFSVYSDSVTSIDMSAVSFSHLRILNLRTFYLKEWKTPIHLEELGILEMASYRLEVFPFQALPKLYIFTYYGYLKEIPTFLCECEMLNSISIKNFRNIEVDRCMERKVYNAYHSSLTVYNGFNGEEVINWESKEY